MQKKISILLSLLALFIFFQYLELRQQNRQTWQVAVHFIDVGQGDSILITSPYGHMLIDGGETDQGSSVAAYLYDQGISKLSYVVSTHPHTDHIGGLAQVISSYEVENVLAPKTASGSRAFESFLEAVRGKGLTIHTPSPGETFTMGDIYFTVLAPSHIPYEETNNTSIVLKMEYQNTSFLFTGDAEKFSEQKMMDAGYDLSAHVLKVGHHGSSTSSSSAFLDHVQPQYAIISCGLNNSYGHPTPEVIKALEQRGSAIYRTDLLGTIIVYPGLNGQIKIKERTE